MPTYEYACKKCGQHLEVTQGFRDDPLTTCPHCGGDLRKVFGSIGIAFKGSGFYKTDSRAARSEAGASSGSGSSESSSGSSGSGSSGSSSGSGTSGSGSSKSSGSGDSSKAGSGSSSKSPAAS